MHRLVVLMLLLPLAGCVTTPASLRGEFPPLQPADAARSGTVGEHVRWGGRVVQVEPLADHSCFEVIGVPLDVDGHPLLRDESSGRFLACRAGFYDPEVFLPGREMTFVGRIDGYEMRKIGEYDYRYPRLAADVVFLWPERSVTPITEQYPYWWGW